MVSLDSLPPLVTRAVAVVGAIFDVLGTILVDGRLASEGESGVVSDICKRQRHTEYIQAKCVR